MATDWENRYQSGDTPWDKGAAHPALVDWLKSHSMPGRVLVPGCGTGNDVRAIASRANAVVGIDIAPSAITTAELQPNMGTETYELADLFALPPTFHGAFDWVWEHTCFCAIDPKQRSAYVRAIVQALKPDGQFLACFYLDPGLDPGESGPPFGVTLDELTDLFSAGFSLSHEWKPAHTFPGREGGEILWLLRRRP